MSAASVLGRGLGSLLPTPMNTSGRTDGTPLYVKIAMIRPRADQPRQQFDPQGLKQLAVSIREQGILQPLVVMPSGDGTYSLIAGERRLRAATYAGLTEVPVVVRHATDAEAYELALIENIQRQDLNPVEEAEAFKRLIEEHAYTQEALARRVGKDRTTVTNALRLLKLRPELRERLLNGAMSAGHARALLGADDDAFQDAVALRIEEEGLSVRAVERLVAGWRDRTGQPSPQEKKDPFSIERKRMSATLSDHFGRKVAIRAKKRGDGGTVTIAYDSVDDLRSLTELLNR